MCFQVCDDAPAVRKQLHRASESSTIWLRLSVSRWMMELAARLPAYQTALQHMQDSILTDSHSGGFYTSIDHVTTDAGLGSHISPPHRKEQTVP